MGGTISRQIATNESSIGGVHLRDTGIWCDRKTFCRKGLERLVQLEHTDDAQLCLEVYDSIANDEAYMELHVDRYRAMERAGFST